MTAKEKAEKLYKMVNTFVLTCIGEDGYPLTKAVAPGRFRKSLQEMYFITNTSSKFAAEIVKNPKASVYFYSRKIVWKGCMLKGDMHIVTDAAIREKYWQNKFKNAYPEKAPSDPDFCVLRFTPISGRYYSWFRLDDFEV
ncbi:MAG: pyridoxamine 5'-phosphate oxidase family protein [Treponema sp.]|nr:pyridoxamine 5'-phosphate oxidase family protein [Treponema sp.]